MPERGRLGLTPPVAGLLVGLLSGIVDATLIALDGSAARAVPVTPLTIAVVVWTWMSIVGLAGALSAWHLFAKLRVIALAFAGPGLLLLSRAATPLKTAFGLSNRYVLLLLVAGTLVLAVPLLFVHLQPSRPWGRWIAVTALSMAAVVYAAADLRVRDFFPAGRRPAQADARRNVVLVFLDTTRHDADMPRLHAFAKQAVTFDSAWAPAAWTMPSHAAVFTGVDPWLLPVSPSGRYHAPSVPLAKRLQARGYATAGVFANSLLTADVGFTDGLEELTVSHRSEVCRSGAGNVAWRLSLNDAPRPPVCAWLTASQITTRALKFVRRAERPYFVAVNYIDGHHPYYVPPECRDGSYVHVPRAAREAVLMSQPERPVSAEVAARTHAQYRAALRCADRSLALLLREVTSDRNTVVAIVGDHGEQFGEHGLGSHGNSVYAQLIRVPLTLHVPGMAPARVAAPVSITDLYESLVRAAEPGRARAPLPLLDERQRRPVVASYEEILPNRQLRSAFAAVRDDFHFIRWRDGTEVLYDYRSDPAEERAIDPRSRPDVVPSLRNLVLEAMRRQTKRPEFDALGYIQ